MARDLQRETWTGETSRDTYPQAGLAYVARELGAATGRPVRDSAECLQPLGRTVSADMLHKQADKLGAIALDHGLSIRRYPNPALTYADASYQKKCLVKGTGMFLRELEFSPSYTGLISGQPQTAHIWRVHRLRDIEGGSVVAATLDKRRAAGYLLSEEQAFVVNELDEFQPRGRVAQRYQLRIPLLWVADGGDYQGFNNASETQQLYLQLADIAIELEALGQVGELEPAGP